MAEQVSRGALLGFDENAQIPVVRGGAGPQSDAALAASLPGQFDLVLRWTGNANLNLGAFNFIVTGADVKRGQQAFAGGNTQGVPAPVGVTRDQLGIIGIENRPPSSSQGIDEFLFPGYGLNTTRSGGLIPFDHRGGKNGGQEIAFWQGAPPAGKYAFFPFFASGSSATFKLDAFLNGQHIPVYAPAVDAEGNLIFNDKGVPVINKYTTLTGTIGPDNPIVGGGITYVPGNVVLDQTAVPVDTAGTARARAKATQPKPVAGARDTGAVRFTPPAGATRGR